MVQLQRRGLLITASALITLGGLVGLLGAQTPMTLERALAQVLNQPTYLAMEQRVESLRSKAPQADRRPNPVVETEIGTASVLEGTSDHVVSLTVLQAWERGGKRRLRRELAEAELEQAEWDLQAHRLDLQSTVQTIYIQILEAKAKQKILDTQLSRWKDLLVYEDLRLQQGEIPPLNPAYLKAEVKRLELRDEQLNAEARMARIKLNALIGLDVETDLVLQSSEPDYALPPLERVLAFAERRHPRLQAARSRLEQSQLQIDLERSRSKPDWQVGVGYHRIQSRLGAADFRPLGLIASARDASNLLEFRLDIPLPLWDDNSGNLAGAIAAGKAVEHELASVRARLKEEVVNAYRDVELNLKLLGDYDELVEGLRDISRREEEAYRLTGEDVLELIASRRQLLETSLARVSSAFAARLSLVRLEQESGGKISEIQAAG